MSIIRNANGKSLYGLPYPNSVNEGTLTVATSPVTLSVQGGIGRHALRGYIANDSTVAFTAQLSNDGTTYNTAFSINAGEKFDLTGVDAHSIKITRGTADAAYRIHAW